MKVRLDSYTFDPIAKTVTFDAALDLSGLLLIVNAATNAIIYNFAGAGLGGSMVGAVLTLDYDTSAMSASDPLLIYYDTTAQNPASEELLDSLYEVAKRLDMLAACRGLLADLRVTPTGTVTISGAVTLASTAISDVTLLGTYSTRNMIMNDQNGIANAANISNVAI